MKMHMLVAGLSALVLWSGCGVLPVAPRATQERLVVLVTADRPDSLYRTGEKARFTVDVMQGGRRAARGEVEVWLAPDGGPGGIVKKRFDLSAQSPIVVEGALDEPAFFLCQAWASQPSASAGAESAYGEKMVWYRVPVNPTETVIEISAGRPSALYRVGEDALFTARVTRNGEPVAEGRLELRLSIEGAGETIASQVFDLAGGGPLQISGTLNKPGFLYCQAKLTQNTEKGAAVSAWNSAGYDVDKLAPTGTMPGDFESFWKETLDRARQLPADVELQELKAFSNDKATYYRFSVNTLNNERLYGFLGIPAGPGPFPAIVLYPGAGPGWSAPIDLGLSPRGAITLMMNVHNYPVSESPAEAQKQLEELIASRNAANALSVGEASRETQRFYTVLIGCSRAVDYICSRSDWDGKRLVVTGTSLGGFLTLATAGLCPDKVSCAISGVPARCDLLRNRHDADSAALKAPVYFDSSSFARLIRCPVHMAVGFADGSCPPAKVFSAYNSVRSADKSIRIGTDEGHAGTPGRQAVQRGHIMRELGFME